MNNLPAVLALLVTTLPIAAQTKILVAKSRVHVAIAGYGYRGGLALPTACDEQGHLYVKLMAGPLFRLSNEGRVEAEFDTSGALINRYAVRPDGGVVMMHIDESAKFIDNFASDGHFESSVAIERPPVPFFPSQLAVFPSGEIFISGLQYRPGYKAATAIYEPTGRLVKQLVFDGDLETEHAIEGGNAKDSHAEQQHTSAVDKSVAITGDDGLVYLMRATSPVQVYAISAVGDVVRKIVVNAPGNTGAPDFGIRVVKSRLVVQFCGSGDSTVDGYCGGFSYTVVDAMTNRKLAAYEADTKAAGTMACYAPDPDRFYIFSENQNGLEIIEADPK
jgi:hypothetical protein